MYCVFGLSSCVGFQQVFGQRLLCSPFVPRSDIEFSDAGETPSLPYQSMSFLQMEKFVFAATRHFLVIVGGVLMGACRMHDAEDAAKDER